MASTELRAAAQQALEFIRWSQFIPSNYGDFPEPPCTAPQVEAALHAALAEDAMQKFTDVNQELQAALAEPVQEPVAWRFEARHIDSAWAAAVTLKHPGPEGVYMRNVVPLYTAPPQRKPLTDEVIADLWHQNGGFHHHFARAIERWLKGNP